MRGVAELPFHPFTPESIDLDVSGASVAPNALLNVRNCFWKDDGTITRRPGLFSNHIPFETNSAISALSLADFPVTGLIQFDRMRENKTTSRVYVAKVNEYLIGSRDGLTYDLKLSRGMGVSAIPDFIPCYHRGENRRYLVACSTDRGFAPAAWGGQLDPSSGSAYDTPDWGYFRPVIAAGYQAFGVFHSQRLYLAGGDPFIIVYSSTTDFRDFANGGAFAMNPQFGEVRGFFKTYYGELLVGQEKAISRVEFSGGLPVGATPITTELGLMNNRCSIQRGNDFFFLGSDGHVHALSTTASFGDILTRTISYPQHAKFDTVPESARSHAFAEDDSAMQIAWFGLSRRHAIKNDTLMGYDYAHEKWVWVENDSIGGFGCGATMQLPRYNLKPRVFFGSYAYPTGGRLWTLREDHKEDACLIARSFSSPDSNAPAHLQGRLVFPTSESGYSGWPTTGVQVRNNGGNYTPGDSTTIVVSANNNGTVGTTVGLTAAYKDIVAGSSGTLTIGSTYTLGTWLSLGNHIEIRFTSGNVIGKYDEVWVLVDKSVKMTETYQATIPDRQTGLQNLAVAGSKTAKNFLAEMETPFLYAGSPKNDIQIRGVTFITRAVGGRADDVTNADSGVEEGSQNQYRFYLDVFVKFDEDVKWKQMALLDGNLAKQFHLTTSLSEVSGEHPGRANRVFFLPSSGLEADGNPLADPLAVNVKFLPITRKCKMVRFLLGQHTMACNAWSATLGTEIGRYCGDFNLVGIILHFDPLNTSNPVNQGLGDMSKDWAGEV